MPEVRLVHNFSVTPGQEDLYAGLQQSEYDTINGQPGCEQWELFQSCSTPQNFALLEHWESRGAFHSYWNIQKVRPIAGIECIDASTMRSEIHWDQKYYTQENRVFVPRDGGATDEVEGRNSPVRLVINMAAKEGMADTLINAWAPHGEEVRQEPGCLQYEMFRSTRNEDNIALLELWESKEAFDAHWALERDRPSLTKDYQAGPGERVVGMSGVEIYYNIVNYALVDKTWTPLE